MLLVFALSSTAFAQSAKEAVMALKKLKIKTENGISFNELNVAVKNTKLIVVPYIEGPGGKKHPDLVQHMTESIVDYTIYLAEWDNCIKKDEPCDKNILPFRRKAIASIDKVMTAYDAMGNKSK